MYIPPCIVAAVRKKDMDCLEDILSFIKTFGDEEADKLLWAIGFYRLDDYSTKKNSLKLMVEAVDNFLCSSLWRPPKLKKYCPEDKTKCRLMNPEFRMAMMIKDIDVSVNSVAQTLEITVTMKNGKRFSSGPLTFSAGSDAEDVFWEKVASDFRDWFVSNMGGENVVAVTELTTQQLASLLKRLVFRSMTEGVVFDESASMR